MSEEPSENARLHIDAPDGTPFREAAHRVADLAADYLARLETYAVLPRLEPGSIRARCQAAPPAAPESLDAILADYRRLVEPNITHWQHPGFMAYFPSVACGPGILGEWLAAGLNSNVMLWRNAPASTEIEEVVVAWLRQMLGLPDAFDGMLTDTASVSSLLALVAARHVVPGLDAREEGLPGRAAIGRLRLYCSTEAHSSIEKAAIVAGIGRAGVRRIPADDAYRMRPDLLAAAVSEDRAAGWWPFCVVATLGTTSSTGVDPAGAIADVCAREHLWMHADAAYAGVAAVVPEMRPLFAGWERADSIVVNPHKWLWTPFDASLLLFRRPGAFRDAFSLVPEYLRVDARDEVQVHDFHEYGIQLGRRFRALKLWIMIRAFGTEAMAEELRRHCRMARAFASWVEADPDWQVLAPHPFATVCLRYRPARLAAREHDPAVRRDLDAWNEKILEHVNRSGEIFLSHTRLQDRYTIRACIGNPRQEMRHVERCWELLREGAGRGGGGRQEL
jgi:aromatic-L-amino-acid decarboxylase